VIGSAFTTRAAAAAAGTCSGSGQTAAAVCALGLIESGAVAVLTICASTGYAAGECVGVAHSFNNSPRRAALFYTANITGALIAAGIILIPGAPLLAIALNATVLATVLLPVTLVFLIMLASDRQLMGRWANKASTNVVAIAIVAFVSLSGAAYGIYSFLQVTHLIGS
jgi:Mn2+/Fe2+ NRAMP family transporter